MGGAATGPRSVDSSDGGADGCGVCSVGCGQGEACPAGGRDGPSRLAMSCVRCESLADGACGGVRGCTGPGVCGRAVGPVFGGTTGPGWGMGPGAIGVGGGAWDVDGAGESAWGADALRIDSSVWRF